MSVTTGKPRRIAFAGFRHGHIMSLYDAVCRNPHIEIVAACESDPATADSLRRQGRVHLTHPDLPSLLANANCDIIAIGDYFAARGSLAITALKAGKHVIADKPICTSMDELDQIAALSHQRHLSVGCLLDLRASAAVRTLRRVIRAGQIGEVQTVLFTAQHPLLLGSRPGWYFEPGKHGGTLNDIAVHGVDAVPWITGRRMQRIHAARAWNARLPQYPHFQDAAQFLAELDNGGGLMGDVSYFAPDGCGYSVPQYWRITCHGTGGVAEIAGDARPLCLATHTDKAVREIALDPPKPDLPLLEFMDELAGLSGPDALTTSDVLEASRQALRLQQAADRGRM